MLAVDLGTRIIWKTGKTKQKQKIPNPDTAGFLQVSRNSLASGK
jgi:hypothetical protein